MCEREYNIPYSRIHDVDVVRCRRTYVLKHNNFETFDQNLIAF